MRKTTRKTYICQSCQPSEVPGKQWSVTSGPATVGPIAKGLCGPGLLAFVLTRVCDRLAAVSSGKGIIARSGVKVSENTLGDWVRKPPHYWSHFATDASASAAIACGLDG